MKVMTVGEFKSRFSEVLDAVREGETVIVSYGRNHVKIAAIIPYEELQPAKRRPLGLLKSRMRVRFSPDFRLTDEQMLDA